MSVAVDERPVASTSNGRRARRFEWCVRISLYLVMTFELFALVSIADEPQLTPAEGGLLLVAMVVHVAANIAVLHWALTSVKSGRAGLRLPVRRLICCGSTTVLVIVVAVTALGPGALALLGYVVGLSWAAVAAAYPFRVLSIGAVVIAVLVATATAVFTDHNASFVSGLAVGICFSVLAIGASVWLSGWMLQVFSELDTARVDSARLAVAEERLRISRDLHDVFGRTLATVAVKSELAAELARRGRAAEAADEIGAVQVIADEAGREVRRVLHGYREADLEVELAGARSLLDAAGIRCTVRGSADGLDPAAASTLGWVVREAVTNLIKHAQARSVTIEVGRGEATTLTIGNDGATVDGPIEPGGGLTGMRERLARIGGELAYERQRDTFTLRAAVPGATKEDTQ